MNMDIYDEIWDEIDDMYKKWRLKEKPFFESTSTLQPELINEVFTGRITELKKVLPLFKGRNRRNLLVYGWIGIGKTAFILEILNIIKRKEPKILTAYITLPANMDLATASLIALAREMPDDDWALHQLHEMGLRPEKEAVKKKDSGKIGPDCLNKSMEYESIPAVEPRYPDLSFESLLKRALDKYDKVVIAIDDLDKKDPAEIRQLLLNAQGLLKSGAWFILTGHPYGLTKELLISARGLFDTSIKLENLDQPTTYQMLVKYLNSVREKENKQDNLEDPQAVYPFTVETAKLLCKKSNGVPRWLNRLGNYVLDKASELKAEIINDDVVQQGLNYLDQQLRNQSGLTSEDLYILELVMGKKVLSDENITLEELQSLKVNTFNEIMPVLDKLIQFDLLKRLPSERAAEYEVTPLVITDKDSEDKT